MTRRNKKPKSTNAKRNLNVIAVDIHAIERRNVFDIGKLLVEAKDACEHGEWGRWLYDEFDWSDSTANNYMNASHLKTKFPTVGNLKVPARTIYEIAADIDDPALPAIIEALASACKYKKILGVVEAEETIRLVELRAKFGDYLDATLNALGWLPEKAEWAAAAVAELKKVRPETAEAASAIVDAITDQSADADDEDQEPAEELDDEQDDEPEQDEPKPEPKPKPKAAAATKETDQTQAAAVEAARSDIGPLSKAEHERLLAAVDEYAARVATTKAALDARNSEVERLEGEIEKLKGVDVPSMSVDKHVEALISQLKKLSREKQELTVERLCKELAIDPHKLDIELAA